MGFGDAELPALSFVLDPDYLGEVLGAPVWIERVRYKPGRSVVVAVRTAGIGYGREQIMWAAGYSDGASAKLDKVAVRAAQAGDRFLTRAVPGASRGHLIGFGEASLDRELFKTFRWWRRHVLGGEHGVKGILRDSTVLRYNPHRRIVLRVERDTGATVVKLNRSGCAHASRVLDIVERAASRVPVAAFVSSGAESVALAACEGVTATEWWGDGDLSMPETPMKRRREASLAAGHALARLHSIPWGDGDGDATASAAGSHALSLSRPLRAIDSNRALLSVLLPNEKTRVETLARQLAARLIAAVGDDRRRGEERIAIVHGDFSADQVLLGPGGDIRLLDFDRARAGRAEEDLGSFAAAELAMSGGHTLTEPLFDGYRAEAGRDLAGRVALWQAYSLFTRAAEPFRRQVPKWSKRVPELLALAERSLE